MTAFERRIRTAIGLAALVGASAAAQQPSPASSSPGTTTRYRPAPVVDSPGATEWTSHNGDLGNSRYSPLRQITPANAGRLAVKWMFRPGQMIGSNGALVVDGVMYLSNTQTVFAVDAVTGEPIWRFEHEGPLGTQHRGPGYGNGVIYAYSGSSDNPNFPSLMYALDAKTGEPISSFGRGGVSNVILAGLQFKYPGRFPDDFNTVANGYGVTTPPVYHDGVLYVVTKGGDRLIPGGLVIAIDPRTAAVKWVFNTVPQGPEDDGWEIAKDSWSDRRTGGGMWTSPALDPALRLLYVNAANPSADYDGSLRLGKNLFTNTTLALDMDTGKLRWHFQTVHHDIWDYDTSAGPALMDIKVKGKTVKAVAAASKTGYLYIWNRETGEPVNPIKEMPVPAVSDLPGEQPWPTQPIPFTSSGAPQQPFVPTLPKFTDPALNARVRPAFTPLSSKEFFIIAPSVSGGANFGGPSYSPRTGLIYVSGIVGTHSVRVRPVGQLKPGTNSMIGDRPQGPNEPATGTLTAYDPATGEQAWQAALAAPGAAGSLTTAGDVIFQGTGSGLARTGGTTARFLAFDARSGKEVFSLNAGGLVSSEPITYMIGGKQYVSVVSTDTVITLALP